MMTRRYFAALASALALAACSPQPASKEERVAVTIGGPPNIALLAEIARENGYFAAEGIDATFQSIQTGKLAQDAVVAGQLDYGLVLDVNTASLGFGQREVKALATLMTKGDDGLVARRDRGINGAADLAGKKVARLTATTGHVFLDRLLESAGVDPSKVTFVTMPPPAMQAAIARGDIDAASLWEPFRQNAVTALGANALNIEGANLYTAKVILIRRNPAPPKVGSQEVRVVRALDKAADFARANPGEAQAITARLMGLPQPTVAGLWHFYGFEVTAPAASRADVERLGTWVSRTQPDFRGKTPDYGPLLAEGGYVQYAAQE
jgi:NitT/TauT family transport system substrate-binding protein